MNPEKELWNYKNYGSEMQKENYVVTTLQRDIHYERLEKDK